MVYTKNKPVKKRPRRYKKKHIKLLLKNKNIKYKDNDLPYFKQLLNDNIIPDSKKKLKAEKAKTIPGIESFMSKLIKHEEDSKNYQQMTQALKNQQDFMKELATQNQLKKDIEDDVDLLERFDQIQNYVDKDGKLSMENMAKFINEINLGKYIKDNIIKIQHQQQLVRNAEDEQEKIKIELQEEEYFLQQIEHAKKQLSDENTGLKDENEFLTIARDNLITQHNEEQQQTEEIKKQYTQQKNKNKLLNDEINKQEILQKAIQEEHAEQVEENKTLSKEIKKQLTLKDKITQDYNEIKQEHDELLEEYNKSEMKINQLNEEILEKESEMELELLQHENKINEIDEQFEIKKEQLKNSKKEINQQYADYIRNLREKDRALIDRLFENLSKKDEEYFSKYFNVFKPNYTLEDEIPTKKNELEEYKREKKYNEQHFLEKDTATYRELFGIEPQENQIMKDNAVKAFYNLKLLQHENLLEEKYKEDTDIVENAIDESIEQLRTVERPDYFESKLTQQTEMDALMDDNIGKNKKESENIQDKIKLLLDEEDPIDELYQEYEMLETEKDLNKQDYVDRINKFNQQLKENKETDKTLDEKAHTYNLKEKTKTLKERVEQEESEEEIEEQKSSTEAQGKYIKYAPEEIPRILIIGAPGSGKTTAAINLIQNLQDENTHTFIITQNYNEEKYIKPENINNYYSNAQQKETQTMNHEELLIKIVEQAQNIKNNNGNTVIMLDDLPELLKNKKVNHFLRTTRAMNCIFIVVCHDITDVAKSDRSEFSNLLLFSGQSTRLKEIADMEQINQKQLKEIYEKNVEKPGDFLLFNKELATIIKNKFTDEILLQPTYLTFETKKIPQTETFPNDGLSIEEVNEELKFINTYNGVIQVDAEKEETERKIHIDKLPQTNVFFIENYNEKGNNHFTALGIDKQEVCYYDSYGEQPCQEIMQMIHNTKFPGEHFLKLKINTIQQQDDNSSTCGEFAIDFIKKFSLGYPFREITKYDDIEQNESERVDDYNHFQRFSFI